jgi:hypothetical protein
MNTLLGSWIRRQAQALYDGERCTAFRLFHVALGERTTALDRYLLGDQEDPAGIIGHVQALAQQHAEAFSGMPQRYMLAACYGDAQVPQANHVWRLSGSAMGLGASEPPTSEGQTAQMMRHVEFLVRTVGEMSAQRIQENKIQTDGMQAYLQWLQNQMHQQAKLASELRLEAENVKDREQARLRQDLKEMAEIEMPERQAAIEEKSFDRKVKAVMSTLPFVAPLAQATIFKKLGIDVSPQMHPLAMRLANAYQEGRETLTPDVIAKMMATLNAQQQQALAQLLLALDEAAKMTAAVVPNDAATTQAPQAPAADAQASAHPVNGARA